jgi:hypothetical protein
MQRSISKSLYSKDKLQDISADTRTIYLPVDQITYEKYIASNIVIKLEAYGDQGVFILNHTPTGREHLCIFENKPGIPGAKLVSLIEDAKTLFGGR